MKRHKLSPIIRGKYIVSLALEEFIYFFRVFVDKLNNNIVNVDKYLFFEVTSLWINLTCYKTITDKLKVEQNKWIYMYYY